MADIPVTGPGGSSPPRADYDAAWARPGYPPYLGFAPAAARRVSWGAIFAGAVVALVVELALGTLGLAIAFGTINPATETQTFQGLGLGTGIWLVVTMMIALFAGGWTAGRLAGLPKRIDAVMHGVVAWGIVTLFSTWMLTNVLGGVVSGAVGLVGSTLGAVGEGLGAMAPAAVGAVTDGQTNVQQEIERFLQQTGDPQLSPEALRAQAEEARGEVGEAVGEAAQQGTAMDQIQAALTALTAQGGEVISEVDRQDAVNVIVARTDLNEAEAGRVVDNWVNQWNQVQARIGEAGQSAAQVTENVTGALGSVMLWTFLAMVIGLGAAAIGGSLGAPKDVPATFASAGAPVVKEH